MRKPTVTLLLLFVTCVIRADDTAPPNGLMLHSSNGEYAVP
ncbi:MAG: hypothetical protein AAF917_14690 [Pseudomonadota bacterium]